MGMLGIALNNEMTSKSERIRLSDTLGSLGSDPPKLQIQP